MSEVTVRLMDLPPPGQRPSVPGLQVGQLVTGHAGRRQFAQVRKTLVPDGKACVCNGCRLGHRLRILVESNQPPSGRQLGKNQARMAATTKGGIYVGAVCCAGKSLTVLVEQCIDRLVKQYGGMVPCCFHRAP